MEQAAPTASPARTRWGLLVAELASGGIEMSPVEYPVMAGSIQYDVGFFAVLRQPGGQEIIVSDLRNLGAGLASDWTGWSVQLVDKDFLRLADQYPLHTHTEVLLAINNMIFLAEQATKKGLRR